MTTNPIHRDLPAAYFHAGVAVVGHLYRVQVQKLSIHVRGGRRTRPRVIAFNEHLATVGANDPKQATIDYATVLLAGSVGRLMSYERHLGLPELSLDRARLRRAVQLEACQCREVECDLAFSIVFGWLKDSLAGDSHQTLTRLWHRADEVLRNRLYRTRLEGIAVDLLKAREMDERAIAAAITSADARFYGGAK